MKNMVLAFGFLAISLLVAAMISSVEIDSGKKQTLTENVRIAVYQTLKEGAQRNYDDETLQTRFELNLKELMQIKDGLAVRIIEADTQQGVLAVDVKQEYRNWGQKREVRAQETVIIDN